MIVVMLGPPGSGKGTQAKKLLSKRGWPQLSTGDMLRSAIQKGTQLGAEAKGFMDQGQLVPDSVVIGLIAERLSQDDCTKGCILDGFPRNIPQAVALDSMLQKLSRSVNRVVFFEIQDDVLVRRISGRRTCTQCNAMYHVEAAPSQRENVCDRCQGALVQRSDDQAEVVQKRLKTYHEQTEPLVGFYKKQNKLQSINAHDSAAAVTDALLELLG